LKNPIMITKKDYEEVVTRLQKVRTVGKYLIECYESNDDMLKDQMTKLRRDFRANKIYERIGETLATVKQSKVDPFQFIKMKNRKIINEQIIRKTL